MLKSLLFIEHNNTKLLFPLSIMETKIRLINTSHQDPPEQFSVKSNRTVLRGWTLLLMCNILAIYAFSVVCVFKYLW